MAYSIHEGYLIYTRGRINSSPVWRQVYQKGLSEGNAIRPIFDPEKDGEDVGNKLISLGNNEFEKERQLLERAGFTINSETDVKTFIQNFNETLQGAKNYKAALTRIKLALSDERQNRKNRAPTIASWFTSYLNTTLNEEINNFLTDAEIEQLNKENYTHWISAFDDIVDQAIRNAFKKMLTEIGTHGKAADELYGTAELWRAYYEASQQIANFNDSFIDMVKSKIDFDSIKDIFQRVGKDGGKIINLDNEVQKNISTLIGSKNGLNLKSGYKGRSIGGSVQEFLEQIADSMGQAMVSSVNSGSAVFKNEKMVIDNVTIFSYEKDLDTEGFAQKIADDINVAMDGNKNLQEASSRMEKFYDQYLSKLNDTFVVYGTTKSYSLSESFEGFAGGGSKPLISLPQRLDSLKICTSKEAEDFIYKLFNTAKYTIFSEEREELTEEGKKLIMSAAAALLFDDWETIGEENIQKGATCIHAMQLEGIRIPLSVFLQATGKAIIETATNEDMFFNVDLKVVESAVKEWAGPDGRVPIDGDNYAHDMLEAWNEQARLAKKESTFTVKFLKNFKSIITDWVNV